MASQATLANRLRSAAERTDLDQADVADLVGANPRTVARWLAGSLWRRSLVPTCGGDSLRSWRCWSIYRAFFSRKLRMTGCSLRTLRSLIASQSSCWARVTGARSLGSSMRSRRAFSSRGGRRGARRPCRRPTSIRWQGSAWRHVATGRPALSGEGARMVGGRCNPRRLAAKQLLAPDSFLPRTLYSLGDGSAWSRADHGMTNERSRGLPRVIERENR